MAKPGAIRACYRDAAARRFPPTAAAQQKRLGLAAVSGLDLNECPLPPSPAVVEAVAQAAQSANRYPDALCKDLGQALAATTGIEASHFVFTNGSDEMLTIVGKVSLAPGDEAVMPTPSFPGYAHSTKLADGKPIPVALRADGTNDPTGLLEAITPQTRLLFCAPINNPSGGMLESAELIDVIEGTPEDVFLVMDDAYGDFAQHAGGPDVLPLMARRRAPWAVLRTFSKSYGMAGLRVGYGIFSSAAVAQAVLQVKSTFNVNSLAQAAALAALADQPYKKQILDHNARERERLACGAEAMGLVAMPGAGNFISLRLPVSGLVAAKTLAEQGFIVRPWVEAGYENCLRITIGTADDTTAVLAALRGVLNAQ